MRETDFPRQGLYGTWMRRLQHFLATPAARRPESGRRTSLRAG